jgi:hypothetical protein
VETGKGADALDRRPQLAAALSAARTAKCSVRVKSKAHTAASHKCPISRHQLPWSPSTYFLVMRQVSRSDFFGLATGACLIGLAR